MPSNKDPNVVVHPTAGKLAAGEVQASSLAFPIGGGSTALQAHIATQVDAHMATAIGVHAIHDPSGQNVPLLSIAGGPFDGESVEDVISQLAALLPTKPDAVGFDNGAVPNSGIPNWGNANTSLVGAFTSGSNVAFTKYVLSNATTAFALTGTIFPADRGVVAVYKSTDGDFFNSGTTTLVGALWLGTTASEPSTLVSNSVPSANFNEPLRGTSPYQTSYVAGGSGLDIISLASRYPYLTDYSALGSAYTGFSANFPGYQLGKYTIASQSLTGNTAVSYLLVHWKETYATTFSAISTLTTSKLLQSNTYSASPTSYPTNVGAYPPSPLDALDLTNILNVNRRNLFRDSDSAGNPSGASFTATASGSASKVKVSGVDFYTGAGLTWNVNTLTANGLWNASYLTGSSASGTNVPTNYVSANDPIRINFSDFGASTLPIPYYSVKKVGAGSNYSVSNPPATGDQTEYSNSTMAVSGPTTNTAFSEALLRAELRSPFATVVYTTTTKYLYNNYTQTGTTNPFLAKDPERFETFVNEDFRYVKTADHTVISSDPIHPTTSPQKFDSTVALVNADSHLQVLGGSLVFPTKNFSTGYSPIGPDYSTFAESTGALREYVRMFNAQGTTLGRLQVILTQTTVGGLAFAFDGGSSTAATSAANHTGGMIIEVRAANDATWYDLGRQNGIGPGCLNGVPTVSTTSGITTVDARYILPVAPALVGGKFPLVVRVTFIKGVGTPTGQNLAVNSIEWFTT